MKRRRKRRFSFKINADTLTSIVIYSLLFCAAVTIAGLVLGGYDHDVAAIIDSTHRVFGTELGVCGFIKIFQCWIDKRSGKSEENTEQ